MENLRLRLIERLCRLPEAHLAEVAALLTRLDQEEILPVISAEATRAPLKGEILVSSLPPHRDWPHAPLHRLSEHGTFIVTASTHNKDHFFRGTDRLNLLQDELLRLARAHEVVLEAWAVFSNHYHFVGHTTGVENQIASFVARLHFVTAEEINRQDGCPGRAIWFNYWDTQLTFEKSYLARLNYVHQNAVKHGLVRQANQYPWCSARWLERTATLAQVKTIYSLKVDRVRIDDDYDPVV